jgi:DNA-binding CsgD family transcriptional regulator
MDNIDRYIHINKRKDLEWVWGNKSATEACGESNPDNVTHKKILDISDTYVFENYKKIIKGYDKTDDRYKSCQFFQRLYMDGRWKWIITHKQILNSEEYLNLSYALEDHDTIGKYLLRTLDTTFKDEKCWQKFQSLSKRERQILFLLLEIEDVPEIADKLFISKPTLRKHMENIRRKTEMNSLLSLMRFAEAFQIIGAK